MICISIVKLAGTHTVLDINYMKVIKKISIIFFLAITITVLSLSFTAETLAAECSDVQNNMCPLSYPIASDSSKCEKMPKNSMCCCPDPDAVPASKKTKYVIISSVAAFFIIIALSVVFFRKNEDSLLN